VPETISIEANASAETPERQLLRETAPNFIFLSSAPGAFST
jgi:hypothetical protein